MIAAVRADGLETCVTLGMLDEGQAHRRAGLDYYNHNLDTCPRTTPTSSPPAPTDDRLETMARVRDAGVNVCCGGIVGMGESRADRVGLIFELASLSPHPERVPINPLVPVEGTRLASGRRPAGSTRSSSPAPSPSPASSCRLGSASPPAART